LQTTVDQASGELIEDSAYVLDDYDFYFADMMNLDPEINQER
jgi:hypothetical protein